ncbi:MAG: class I SAM-dependent methyltransferase [Bacilli bacterium]|nr:class I SAM-dependent methyltransferase [Bacilli bacterium]
MSHYFTNDYVKSNEVKNKCIINNHEFTFITDNGVFSKRGLDFGTRTILESISDISGDVLDLGCGYGPIGIYVKKVFDADVDAVDVNLRAISLTKKNSIENNVIINVFESDMYSNVNKKYDHIITNPPIRVGKKILYDILFKAKEYLKDNGKLWLVINKNQGAKTLVRDLENEYKVEIVKKNKGFYIICCHIN